MTLIKKLSSIKENLELENQQLNSEIVIDKTSAQYSLSVCDSVKLLYFDINKTKDKISEIKPKADFFRSEAEDRDRELKAVISNLEFEVVQAPARKRIHHQTDLQATANLI